jgi:PAS domain S-box-containing protein
MGMTTAERRTVDFVDTVISSEESHDVIYPAIVEQMRDGVLAIDGLGNIISINAPACAILRLRPSDLAGRIFAEAVLARRDLDEVSDAMIDAVYAPDNVLTRGVTVKGDKDERNLVIRTSMLLDKEREHALGVVAIISDVSEKVRGLRERIEFGHLVVLFTSMLGFANVATLIIDQHLDVNIYSPAFSMGLPRDHSGAIFLTAHRLAQPAASLGLTLDNWRQAVIEGGAVAFVMVGCLYVGSMFRGPTPVMDGVDYGSISGVGVILLLYGPHSFEQELLSRGALQGSLARLLNDQAGIRSLLVASLIFGLFHSHFGQSAVLVTGLSGLVFGYLFRRHKNLIGATIARVAGGTAVFALHVM